MIFLKLGTFLRTTRAPVPNPLPQITAAEPLTFSPHADFEALLQPAVLALVPVVLVDGAVSVPPAGVGQVPPHGALEEALASLAGELAVMLPAGLVPANHAVHVGDLVPGKRVVPRGGPVGSPRAPAGLLAAHLELRPRICRNVLWPLVYYHCHAIPKPLIFP